MVDRLEPPNSGFAAVTDAEVAPRGDAFYVTGGSTRPSEGGNTGATVLVRFDTSDGRVVWSRRFTPGGDEDESGTAVAVARAAEGSSSGAPVTGTGPGWRSWP